MSDWSLEPKAASPALGRVLFWPKGMAFPRPHARHDTFLISVSQDLGDFAGLWPTLSSLEDGKAFCHPYQCRDNLEAWLQAAGDTVKPFFVGVSLGNGDPVMMVPLGLKSWRGFKTLTFLGQESWDYNGPVIYPAAAKLEAEALPRLWRSICRRLPLFDLVRFEGMTESIAGLRNPLFLLAQEPSGHEGGQLRLGRSAVPSCPDVSQMRNSGRRLRRLGRMGEVRFGVARTEEEILAVQRAFLRQAPSGQTGPAGYYLAAARHLPTRAAFSYLQVGDQIIATAFSLVAGRRLYYLAASSQGGVWRSFAPDWLLLEELVRQASLNGIETIDLGVSDGALKRKWRNGSVALWRGQHPVSLKGLAYCTAAKLASKGWSRRDRPGAGA